MSSSAPWSSHVRPGAVWAFDVDGTLIGSVRSDVVRPGALDLLASLDQQGVVCVVWSAGGDDYARRIAVQHGFHHLVSAFYGKHDRDAAGRYVITHFDDHHRPDVFVDDVPADLPAEIAVVVAVPQFIGGNPADQALRSILGTVVSPPDPGSEGP